MAAPVPEGGWSVYDSYTTDPHYQLQLLGCYMAVIALASIIAVPSIFRFCVSQRRANEGWTMRESWRALGRGQYARLNDGGGEARERGWPRAPGTVGRSLAAKRALVSSMALRPIGPASVGLTVGHCAVLALIPGFILAALLPEQQLLENPNRAGFLALACVPATIILSSKASVLALITGLSYERVNVIHRWIGRSVFILGLTHGSIWLSQYASQGTLKDIMSGPNGEKERRGVLALSFLFLLSISSLRPIRRHAYALFLSAHVLGYVGFAVAICVHTPYAWSWIAWSYVLIYGLDLIVRLARMRIYTATIIPIEGSTGGSTRVFVHAASAGWRAGQHVHVRAFFTASKPGTSFISRLTTGIRPLESHPLTIARAPPSVSVISTDVDGLNQLAGFPLVASSLGPGTWSGDLLAAAGTGTATKPMQIRVIVDGPYGGLEYETPCTSERILLLAGGSGASYAVALLDEIVGRVVRGERGARTTHIDLAWSVRDYGEVATFSRTIDALILAAEQFGALVVRVIVFVTCPCSGPDATDLPKRATIRTCPRPSIRALVYEAISGSADPSACRCDLVGCCGNGSEKASLDEVPVLMRRTSTNSVDALDDLDAIRPLPACCQPAVAPPAPSSSSCCGAKSEGNGEKGGGRSCCKAVGADVVCSGGCCAPVRQETARVGGSCCGACGLGGDSPAPVAGLFVGVCGPASMIADARSTVASLPIKTSVAAGGVQLVSEAFSL